MQVTESYNNFFRIFQDLQFAKERKAQNKALIMQMQPPGNLN